MMLPRPSLLLPFDRGVLDARLSTTRAGPATWWDVRGRLRTAAPHVPRLDHDPATGVCRGVLIEPSATNLLLHSADFSASAWDITRCTVVPDATTAPDGQTTADKLVEDTSSVSHYVRQVASVAAGVTHAFSVFAKAAERSCFMLHFGTSGPRAGFDLAAGTVYDTGNGGVGLIQPVGAGWYRCTVVGDSDETTEKGYIILDHGGTPNYTGDGVSGLYLWGAQLEAGAAPTSPIGTTTAAVTRAGDAIALAGGAFADLWSAGAGTLFVTGAVLSTAATMTWATLGNGTAGTGLTVGTEAPGAGRLAVSDGGTVEVSLSPGAITAGVTTRIACAFADADFACTRDGGAVATAATGSVPAIDRLEIGTRAGGTETMAGHIRHVALVPHRLSNATLQALTA